MKIYLADLDYVAGPADTSIIPLNVGYVGAYVTSVTPDVTVEIFKHPAKLLERMTECPPDVLGLSQYKWNDNLNIAFGRRAKRLRPKTTVVLGGPSFDEQSPDWISKFFRERPHLDFFLAGAGGWNFAKLIELLADHGGDAARIPIDVRPSSYYAFDSQSGEVVRNLSVPEEKLSLDQIPSPYLTGLLDEFLSDERLSPIIETNRGCPYSCAFCSWGAATKSKVFQFPIEQVLGEIGYIAERTRNANRQLYIADANFGIIKRDLELSRFIRECSSKYDFPRAVYVYFAKNLTESVIEVATNLKGMLEMSMSKQSLNAETLHLMKRSNISHDRYDELRAKCESRGIKTFCELIYGMPGETYESFIAGARTVIRAKQNLIMYPYMMDTGSEGATTKARRKYEYQTAFRILPRRVGSFGDLHSLEYEEIVVGNKWLNRDGYMKIRTFHLLMVLFNLDAFKEMRHGLELLDLDHATLAERIISDRINWTPIWRRNLDQFMAECSAELLGEEQLKTEFTEQDLKGIDAYGLALNPMFLSRTFAERKAMEDFGIYLTGSLARFFGTELDDEDIEDLVNASRLSLDKLVCFENVQTTIVRDYNYDIDAWLANNARLPLRQFHATAPHRYRFELDDDVLPAFEETMKWARDIPHAVYILRMHRLFNAIADRIYSYKRVSSAASLTAGY